MAIALGSDVEYAGSGASDGLCVGRAASSKVGFYGKAPIVQRTYSSAVHATSALATSASFGATQLAAIQEIQSTLIALGVWATA